jgi:hypothetical protein
MQTRIAGSAAACRHGSPGQANRNSGHARARRDRIRTPASGTEAEPRHSRPRPARAEFPATGRSREPMSRQGSNRPGVRARHKRMPPKPAPGARPRRRALPSTGATPAAAPVSSYMDRAMFANVRPIATTSQIPAVYCIADPAPAGLRWPDRAQRTARYPPATPCGDSTICQSWRRRARNAAAELISQKCHVRRKRSP